MIYIGIPVHNEEHTIGPLLWRIRELLMGLGRDFHVLVLDDGSDDGTADRLAPYPQILPMTLLRHDVSRGYAASLERLAREAVARSSYPKRDALVTLQADFTDAPESIPELVRCFEGGADLVIGVPGPGSRTPRRLKMARLGARLLARSLERRPEIRDPYGTLRLYRLFTLARALDAPDADSRILRHDGWAADAELLLRVLPHARRAEEMEAPVDFSRRYRESRLQPLDVVRDLRRAARDPALRALMSEAAARPS